MKRDFVSVPANDAQTLRDLLPAELSDVNGGNYTPNAFPFIWTPRVPGGVQSGNPVPPVVQLPSQEVNLLTMGA